MKKKIVNLFGALIGILLLFTVTPIWAQQNQQATVNVVEEQTEQTQQQGPEKNPQPKDVFTLEESIVKNLEGRISDEKFELIGELKGKDFSEAQLTEALRTIALSEEEVETVLNFVHERQKFVEAIRKAASVAMAMDKIVVDIQKKEEIFESIQQEEEKEKLAKEIKEQRKAFKQQEHKLSGIIADIDGTQAEQVAAVLKDAGRESDEIEIITRHILNQALFVKKLATLSEMAESIDSINKELGEYEQKLKKAGSEEEKKSITDYLVELNDRLKKTKNNFSVLTTGIDYSTFLKKEGKEVDWEKELKEIFSPIIVELKETTERPRKMERLRSDILYLEKRIPQVRQASKDLDKFLEQGGDKKVTARLKSWQEYWQQQEKEFSTQLEADKNQLLQAENERKSLVASFKVFFDSFVKHRGKNLFFALLAFVGIYLLFRFIQRGIQWISPLHRSSKYMFWANLVDVMLYSLALIVATGALIAVLFTSGDWLILAIVMLLVLGVIWGARNTLPHFIEQIKLLLGFGPVRQGEKIVIDGIPYRVEMMGVYSYLNNPLLTGGTLRLPLKDLVGMRSRPYDEHEPWFPCKEGETVLIDGSIMRTVLMITPQYVKLDWYGCDMDEYMPTSVFMNKTLLSLARPFWVGITFRLAYQHREYQEIVDKLTPFVREEIKKLPYAEHIVDIENPWIELGSLDETSLSFLVWIQARPEIAAKYNGIKRTVTHICLRAANKYEWNILQLKPVEVHHPEQAKALLGNSVEA